MASYMRYCFDLPLTQLLVGHIGYPKKDRQPLLALILCPKTVPNVSTYRPDYPFQEQLCVFREVTPLNHISLSKD